MSNRHSIVHWCSDLEKHRCGYCKNLNTNCSYGMWAETLTVEDYQNLIDRGWRRSGKYCYKPVMDMTCCPLYTIRCEALHVKLSKSQKKILKRMNKYLSDSTHDKNNDNFEPHQDGMASDIIMVERPASKIDLSKIDTSSMNIPVHVAPKKISVPKPVKPESSAQSDVHSKVNTSMSTSEQRNIKLGMYI